MKISRKPALLVLLLSFNFIVWSQNKTSDTNYAARCTVQKENELIKNPSPAPARKIEIIQNRRTKASSSMSFYNWYSYSGSSLVRKLKQTTDYQNQLKSLFDFEESYGSYVFSNSNVAAVAKEMYNISIAHNGTFDSGMYGLVNYLHAAVYHNFFQKTITLDENSLYWYRLACESFTQNAHLFEINTEAISILDEFIVMVDQEGVRHRPKVIELLKQVMRNLVTKKNWKSITDDRLMRSYATMANRIFFLMFRGVQPADDQYIEALKDDAEFYNLAYQIAVDEDIKNNSELNFLQDNSVGEIARAASIKKFVPLVDQHLSEISKVYPRLHVNWLRAVEAINKYCDCSKFNLCEDLDALRAEIDQKLFPHTWEFDNGKMRIKTSLSYEHVEPLYYAAKQVEAQMYRILQTDQSVIDDPNETLNMVVYGTLEEYQAYQTFLNNLATNNGGMYIERDATFYTYERTRAQSTYSLEELFRHEYTHYLQGRYIENGFWGSTEFFRKNRLTWFEEGMAEFMAGSTSSDGIKFRKSMMKSIASDGENKLPVNETIGASYNSGFKFYRYAYIIWLYMYHKDMATMRELMNYIKADNIVAFDTKVNSLKNSSAFQQKIDSFTKECLTKTDQWWTPTTPYLPDNDLNVGKLTDIEKEFKAISGLSEVEIVSDAEHSISRFGIKGKLQGGQFNQQVDQLIKKLNADKYINNFDYLVGYYKNISGSAADFYITGSLKDKSVSDTPECSFVIQSSTGLVGETFKVRSTSRGYIKGLKWEANNGVFTDDTATETEVKFTAPGKYDISLTVTGNDGKTYTHTIENALDIYAASELEYCEVITDNDYAYIEHVGLGAIDNSNTLYHEQGYADFTEMVSKVSCGTSYPLSVDISYSTANANVNAWVDWNQDGNFDSNEQIMHSIGKNPLTNDFIVPVDAVNGLTRLRIRYALGLDLDACEYNSFIGETHDYSLVIEGGIPKDTELPTKPAMLSATDVDTNSLILHWEASTDNIAIKAYQVWVDNNLFATLSSNTLKLEDLTSNTEYAIHIVAIDKSNNESTPSNTLVVSTEIENDGYSIQKSRTSRMEYIKRVLMPNLSNRTESNSYADYTDMVSTVKAGELCSIKIKPGFRPDEKYNVYMVAWIDWNKNKSFEDDEIVLDQNRNSAKLQWFFVPETFSGSTRMRIALQYGSKPNSLDELLSGEVEDYTISTSGTKQGQTEINEIFKSDTKQTFTAYPNPTQGNINLRIPVAFSNANIRLINNLGITVINKKVSCTNEVLHLNGLPSGNYFIIINNDTDIIKKQIIVN